MKKLILIFCLAYTVTQAQQTCRDSALIQIQKDFKHLRTNLHKAQELHNAGTVLHIVGLWSQVIAITGYKQDYYGKQSYSKIALASLGLNALAFGFQLYSHKFVNRAALEITPGSVKVKF